MISKAFIFLGLLLAMILFISSQVTARDLADVTSTTIDTSAKETENTNGAAVKDAKYPGGYNGGYNGGGGYPGGYPVSGGGGYCRYGCCGRDYGSNGCRCCNYAGEKVDANPRN